LIKGSLISSLARAYRKVDPAAKSDLEILLYPGVRALFLHRLAHPLYKSKFYFLARCLSEIGRLISGIEIHPGAQIGKNLVIDHGMGVVIGETAEIMDDVVLYQGVTLGGHHYRPEPRHPIIRRGATIGAGAKIIGRVTIGEGARVGANAVVLGDVPAGATVVGVPGKISH